MQMCADDVWVCDPLYQGGLGCTMKCMTGDRYPLLIVLYNMLSDECSAVKFIIDLMTKKMNSNETWGYRCIENCLYIHGNVFSLYFFPFTP